MKAIIKNFKVAALVIALTAATISIAETNKFSKEDSMKLKGNELQSVLKASTLQDVGPETMIMTDDID